MLLDVGKADWAAVEGTEVRGTVVASEVSLSHLCWCDDGDADDRWLLDCAQWQCHLYIYTMSGKKVTPVYIVNSSKQCQILTEFSTNNAMSNHKQITKFK